MSLVLVDTSVWSEALRRQNTFNKKLVDNLKTLIENSRAVLIGPIRQELLSGIKNKKQFDMIKSSLEAFEEIKLKSNDYEFAATLNNKCRNKGVQGSHIDYLICAVAINNDIEIFTTDNDFKNYKKHTHIKLYKLK